MWISRQMWIRRTAHSSSTAITVGCDQPRPTPSVGREEADFSAFVGHETVPPPATALHDEDHHGALEVGHLVPLVPGAEPDRFPVGLVQRESGVEEREGQVRDGDSPSAPSVRR